MTTAEIDKRIAAKSREMATLLDTFRHRRGAGAYHAEVAKRYRELADLHEQRGAQPRRAAS